jgi:DNA-nicking Smr family endonuclease
MRRLNPEEKLLWTRVVESVRPYHAPPEGHAPDPAPESDAPAPRAAPRPAAAPARPKTIGSTLDGSWDRRLGRGLVQPDAVLDLHGHNLATAWDLLDSRLESAIASGARVLLLITGKPPDRERPAGRGRIRAAVGDWLAASRHAAGIAAVRGAHPRHGGAGALYIVLRRKR